MRVDELTLGCAFRYALGRQTYVVGHIVDTIINNWEEMGDGFKDRIVKEILEHKESWENVGMKMDEDQWLQIINKRNLELNNEIKTAI